MTLVKGNPWLLKISVIATTETILPLGIFALKVFIIKLPSSPFPPPPPKEDRAFEKNKEIGYS